MRWIKALIGVFLVFVLILAGFGAFVWSRSEAAFAERLPIRSALQEMPATVTDVTYGAHLYVTRGCGDCHGPAAEGAAVIDVPPMGTIVAPNLTRGRGGLEGRFMSIAEWDVAVRHGVAPEDGRKLLLMPSYDYAAMADSDLRSLVAFLRSTPDVDSDLPPITVGPVPRVMHTLGKMDTFLAADLIDHDKRPPATVEITASVEYGAYLANSCIGCHGPNLSGGKVPGGDPSWPPAANLTPGERGLGNWGRPAFFAAMREGVRPDGSAISKAMPWPAMSQMTDTELDALWLYLSALPPQPFGNR